MACYRSRDNWHSYVKNTLSEAELDEMTSHLAHCPECRDVVSVIRETVDSLAKSRVNFRPPAAIKINVMMAIDKNRYSENLACAYSPIEIKTLKMGANSSYLFELRNWGFSMIAAGILLFALNLTSLTPNFEANQMIELHTELSKQMAIPFEKISQVTSDALGKIESLKLSKHK